MAEGDGSTRNFRSAYYEKLGFCGNEEKNILDLLIASSPFDLEKLSDLCERFDMDRRCIEAWKILLGVECGKKNPFDEFANVRRVRAEHFQSLRHHLEVLLKHNSLIKNRMKKSSNSELKPLENLNHSHENTDFNSQKRDKHSEVSADDEENEVVNKGHGRISSAGVKDQNTAEDDRGKRIVLMYLLEAGKLDSSDMEAQLNCPHCLKLCAVANFFVNVSKDLQEAFFLFRNFSRKLENEVNSESEIASNKT